MKRLAVLLLLVCFIVACAHQKAIQPATAFEKSTAMPGFTKIQIYNGIKAYLAQNKNYSIVADDPGTATIQANGQIPYTYKEFFPLQFQDFKTKFNLRAAAQDGGFSVSFTDLRVAWPASGKTPAGERTINKGREYDEVSRDLVKIPDEIAKFIRK